MSVTPVDAQSLAIERFFVTLDSLRPEWQRRALCRGMGSERFFGSRGSNEPAMKAKAVCRVCPVSEECLAYARENHDRFGIWGGTTSTERRDLGYIEDGDDIVADTDID